MTKPARQVLEEELARLCTQRERYALAAEAATDPKVKSRRAARVERLDVEIDSLAKALASLEGDHTAPMSLGPLAPVRAVNW